MVSLIIIIQIVSKGKKSASTQRLDTLRGNYRCELLLMHRTVCRRSFRNRPKVGTIIVRLSFLVGSRWNVVGPPRNSTISKRNAYCPDRSITVGRSIVNRRLTGLRCSTVSANENDKHDSGIYTYILLAILASELFLWFCFPLLIMFGDDNSVLIRERVISLSV